jgi:hypothetical protein
MPYGRPGIAAIYAGRAIASARERWPTQPGSGSPDTSPNHEPPAASSPKPGRSGTSAPARPVTRAAVRISWPVRRQRRSKVGAKKGCDRSSGRARLAPGRHLHPRAIAPVSRRGFWCRPTRNAPRHRARLLDRRADTGVRRPRRQGSSASFTVGCRGRWRAAPARSMRKRASRGRVRCWANGAEWPRASKAIERRAEGRGECGRGGEALLPGRPPHERR